MQYHADIINAQIIEKHVYYYLMNKRRSVTRAVQDICLSVLHSTSS